MVTRCIRRIGSVAALNPPHAEQRLPRARRGAQCPESVDREDSGSLERQRLAAFSSRQRNRVEMNLIRLFAVSRRHWLRAGARHATAPGRSLLAAAGRPATAGTVGLTIARLTARLLLPGLHRTASAARTRSSQHRLRQQRGDRQAADQNSRDAGRHSGDA